MPASETKVGQETYDIGVRRTVALLNEIDGIATLQSCDGTHEGAERHAHVWFRVTDGRLFTKFAHRAQDIVKVDAVEQVAILYGREWFPVVEILYARGIRPDDALDVVTAVARSVSRIGAP